MTTRDHVIAHVVDLLEKGSVPKSASSASFLRFLKPMLETGAVYEERSGTGRRLTVRRPEALRNYLRQVFPDVASSRDALDSPSRGLSFDESSAHASYITSGIHSKVHEEQSENQIIEPARRESRVISDASPLVYISYDPADEELLREFEAHLAVLKRDRIIRAWHSRLALAGADVRAEAERQLGAAQIAVLLLSASYLANDHLYEQEMLLALERRQKGELVVVPVIAKPCDWLAASLAGFEPLPRNGTAVRSWTNQDEAWVHIVGILREIVMERSRRRKTEPRNHKLPTPTYENAEVRALAEQLESARQRQHRLWDAKENTTEVDAQILDLRRRLREGGRLRAGDFLGEGRYLLLNRIGQGGFASVWRGQDRVRRERVAIKVLHPEQAGDLVRRERFFRGARVMATLGHEAVVRVLSQCAEDAGHFYFVMELAERGDLHHAVVNQRMRPVHAVRIILAVGDALAEAHAKGIVHRDVKPSNIVLTSWGAPRLTDFDLVSMADTTGGTRTGVAMGSFLFMAPEQGDSAKEADTRADVYALGMTALFCLHGGELPRTTVRTPERVIAALTVDPAVKDVLTRAIELEPADRFADARAFCKALRNAVLDQRGNPSRVRSKRL